MIETVVTLMNKGITWLSIMYKCICYFMNECTSPKQGPNDTANAPTNKSSLSEELESCSLSLAMPAHIS